MNFHRLPLACLLILHLMAQSASATAQARKAKLKALADRLKYQEGKIELPGGLATVNLTEGFRYLDPAGTETVLTGLWGNPGGRRNHLGMIVPADFNPFAKESWCVVVAFEEDGY